MSLLKEYRPYLCKRNEPMSFKNVLSVVVCLLAFIWFVGFFSWVN